MNFWSALWFRLLGRVPCLRRRVFVNLENGDAIEGVLFQHAGRWLVLKSGKLISRHATIALDGDVVIECVKVTFIQAVD
jgi:hypothetical protein